MRILLLISALVLCLLAWDFATDRYQPNKEAILHASSAQSASLSADKAASISSGRVLKRFTVSSRSILGEMAPIIKSSITGLSPCNQQRDA